MSPAPQFPPSAYKTTKIVFHRLDQISASVFQLLKRCYPTTLRWTAVKYAQWKAVALVYMLVLNR
ncbi:hypothetical protein QQ045_003091 [Rhodiola kirilowii]